MCVAFCPQIKWSTSKIFNNIDTFWNLLIAHSQEINNKLQRIEKENAKLNERYERKKKKIILISTRRNWESRHFHWGVIRRYQRAIRLIASTCVLFSSSFSLYLIYYEFVKKEKKSLVRSILLFSEWQREWMFVASMAFCFFDVSNDFDSSPSCLPTHSRYFTCICQNGRFAVCCCMEGTWQLNGYLVQTTKTWSGSMYFK